MSFKNRICFIFLMVILLMVLLTCKIFFLQVFSHNKYYRQAAQQRTITVKLKNNRGIIYDRNMIPLLENQPVKYAVVYPEFILNKKETSRLLMEITGTNKHIPVSGERPFAVEIIKEAPKIFNELEKNNVLIIDSNKRYGKNTFARHLIGYVSPVDNHGKSGVEIICDKYLYSTRQKAVGIIANSKRDCIGAFNPRYIDENSFKGEFDIRLTLDYHIQKIVEDEMSRSVSRGAVVVMGIKDGDILAMASKPGFEQDSVYKYIDKNGTELINRATKPFNVGSIFKIITAAAALDGYKSFLNDRFHCSGGIDINGHLFRCSSSHGYLSLQDAFSASCNSAFIELGIKTGKEKLLEMAKRLGLGSNTNLDKQGFSESPGKLPNGDFTSNKEVANLSIGQGEVLATPVQVASLISTIANNGIKVETNIIDSVIDSKGKIVKNLKTYENKRVLPVETAWKVKKMMELVTEKGTGKKANAAEYGGTAGKTGTAQTGWKENEATKVHAWFAGYFPRENPQYAAVIFVEDGKSGSGVAAPIFGTIARDIMKLGKR